MGVTKRSISNRYLGDRSRSDIRDQNLLVARVCVLLTVLTMRCVHWIVEQPLTSTLYKSVIFHRFLKLKSKLRLRRVRIVRRFQWLGAYGCQLPKPTVLVGFSPVLGLLRDTKKPAHKNSSASCKKTTLKVVNVGGKARRVHRIYGIRKALQKSQAYPTAFCVAVAREAAVVYRRSLCLL